jgi:hypothetical protein
VIDDFIKKKKGMFSRGIKFLRLNNQKTLAKFFLTVSKLQVKIQCDRNRPFSNVCVVFLLLFFPVQLLSEHRVFSQRQAVVQVGDVL